MSAASAGLNPRRMVAGRVNRSERGPLTEEGRQHLRAAALRVQPWRQVTGPRTPQGKARSADNGRYRQVGPQSLRQARRELADVWSVVLAIEDVCRGLVES
jgi:hypothetical protein